MHLDQIDYTHFYVNIVDILLTKQTHTILKTILPIHFLIRDCYVDFFSAILHLLVFDLDYKINCIYV